MNSHVFRASVLVLSAASGALGAGSLSAHWKFDEAPGATTASDSSGNGLSGTLIGAATFAAGGVSGNAISLNQSTGDMVDVGNVLGFPGQAFSVAGWMNSTQTGGYGVIAAKHTTGFLNGYILAFNTSSTYGSPNKASSYVSANAGNDPRSTTTVNDGQWHHVVLTYNPAGLVTIFVDGVREDTRPPQTNIANSASFLVGGVMNSGGTRLPFFTGKIDDLQVYAGALTGPQVCFIYNNPGQPAPPACDGDANNDFSVDFDDLNLVLSNFNASGFCLDGDLDGDGSVTFADLNLVLSRFAQPC